MDYIVNDIGMIDYGSLAVYGGVLAAFLFSLWMVML